MNSQTPDRPASHFALAALLAPSVVLVFVPTELYVANSPFLAFPLVTHLMLVLPAVLLTAASVFRALRLAPRRATALATPMLIAFGLTVWVLATFLRDGGGRLLGRQFIDPPQPSPPSLLYYTALIGSLAAFTYFGRIRPAAIARLGWTLVGLLTAYATYAVVSDGKRMPDLLGSAKVAQFSQTQPNVVVLLIDSLQNDLALSILKEDPRLADELEGFVYYRNAISASPSTYGSVPAIHSGVTLQATPSLSETYELGVRNGSFLVDLARQGYTTSLVNTTRGICPEDIAFCSTTDVTVEGFFRSVVAQSLYLVDLTIYRLAPREIRNQLYNDGQWFLSTALPTGRLSQHAAATMAQLSKASTLDSPTPTAKFIHLFHAHHPFTVDADCRERDVSYTPEAAKAAGHCALRMLANVVRALRSKGIYDTTLIVVVADHGLGIVQGPDGKMGYEYADPFKRMVTFASAAMAVKRLHSIGALTVSEDLVSTADVRKIVCEQTGACGTAAALLANGDRHVPVRRFSHYDWEAQFHTATLEDRMSSVAHFIVRGDHRNHWSWMPAMDNAEFEVSEVKFSSKDPEAVFGPGWSPPYGAGEHTWRCAIGDAAQLYLNLPDGSPRITFFLKNSPANVDQRVTIRLNGAPIGEVRPSMTGSSHSVRVPEAIRGRAPAVVTFSFSQAIPPPGDPRPIGGCFFNLVVERE